MKLRLAGSFLPIALLLPFAAGAPFANAAEKVPGEEWEMTTKMSMPGMPMQMPARTTKICRAKGKAWDEPPMDKASQDRCKMTDYKVSGNHATWKVTCEGDMSGTGDMTFQADSYAGTMTMKTEAGSMKMELSGKRTGKDCDAEENTRVIERAKKQSEDAQKAQVDAMAAMCREGAASVNRYAFIGPAAQCKTPELEAAFCKSVASEKGYEGLLREGNGETKILAEVAAFCGTTGEAIRADLCPKALAGASLDFVGRHCPGEAKSYAQQHCAGRKFTSIPEASVRGFCASYAEKLLSGK